MSKLTVKEKIGYSLGELGSTIVWQGMMFYLGYFYTDVFQIPASAAAVLLFMPKFLDALIDPIIGTIADRTNTRWGKFRPFILFLFIPFSIFMVLTFTTPAFSQTGRLIYAYATYMIMMLLYSLIMTPYNALGGVLTNDHKDRTSLQSYRFFMAFFGGFILRIFTNPLVGYFGGGLDANKIPINPQEGFMKTFMIFSILSALAFYFTFRWTKERVKSTHIKKSTFKEDIRDLFHNKPWIILFIVTTLNLIYVGAFSTSTKYYFDYYVAVKELNIFGWDVFGLDIMSIFNGFSSLVIMLVLVTPFTSWISNKLGKRNVLFFSFFLVGISIVGWYFCGPEDIGMILFWQLIQSAAAAATMPLIWSMYADAADYSEWVNGRRATGLVFSAVVLGQKVGIALGGTLPLWLLSLAGYSPQNTNSPEVLQAIRMSMGLVPGVIAFLTAAMCLFYKLSNDQMDKIQEELTKRRLKSENSTASSLN